MPSGAERLKKNNSKRDACECDGGDDAGQKQYTLLSWSALTLPGFFFLNLDGH